MSEDIEAIYQRYADTFAAKVPADIAANHAESGTFWLHNGGPAVEGREAIAATFGGFFHAWPQFGFEVRRVIFAPRHWVLDWVITAVLPSEDGGRPVRVDALDVIDLDASGLVQRKDTWLDGAHLRAALAARG